MTTANETTYSPSSAIERLAADIGLTVNQRGAGRPVLLLHGGGGPFSVSAFADDLAQFHHVLTPIHPGFAGAAQRAPMPNVKELAQLYTALLERAGFTEALVVGCSMGGWIAAEMAILNSASLAGVILVNAAGIEVPGQSILDVFAVPPEELASYSYHAPDRFRIDPSKLTEQQAAAMRTNFAALAHYGRGQNMQDPSLRQRLAAVKIPALVVWGESDRVILPDYGRAYAAAFPKGRFELVRECGHMPQIEQRPHLLEIVRAFEKDLDVRN